MSGFVWGQTVSSGSQSVLQTVMQEQQVLGQEFSALIGNGSTPVDLHAWQIQHASEIQALQSNAQILAAQSEMQPFPYITEVNVPDDASQDMVDFLTTQAELANGFAQIHNQQVQSFSSASAQVMAQSPTDMDSMRQIQKSQISQFEQQFSSQIQAQQQRAKAFSAVVSAMPVPDPLVIPASATPQMGAFLTLRDQLMRSQIQIFNQNLSSDAVTRNAAMLQWEQQNAVNFDQLRQLAQNITITN